MTILKTSDKALRVEQLNPYARRTIKQSLAARMGAKVADRLMATIAKKTVGDILENADGIMLDIVFIDRVGG